MQFSMVDVPIVYVSIAYNMIINIYNLKTDLLLVIIEKNIVPINI